MKKYLQIILLAFSISVTGRVAGQYYQIVNGGLGSYYSGRWNVPFGVDSIRAALWGAGYQNGATGNYDNGGYQELNAAGGGGAFSLSSIIPVTYGQTFYASFGIGTNYGNNNWTVPFWQNTLFGPFPDGSYDTAYGGYYGVGGQASVTGPYLVTSWAGGAGATNSGYGNGNYGGAGASANLYGAGANGTSASNGNNGQPGIGQYGGSSGSVGIGTYGNGTGTSTGITPGGGGGYYAGGPGEVIITAHFDHNKVFNQPGQYTWIVPPGVTTIYIQMWGAGGANGSNGGGGGGAFTQSRAIIVTAGQQFTIYVGAGGNSSYPNGGNTIVSSSSFSYYGSNNSLVPYGDTAYGGTSGKGGIASSLYSGGLVESFPGGNGSTVGGGGAAANPFGWGLNATGGSGAQGYYNGGSGAGSGAPKAPAGFGGGGYAYGANGAVVISYSCNNSPYVGTIGNGHTVTYPPELIPDSIKSTTVIQSPKAVKYVWEQSTDKVNWMPSKTSSNALGYRFDQDSLHTTTYYTRGSNACYDSATFGNWSDTVQIKLMTSITGRNGQITGYVQTRNGTAIHGRKVYAESLTPLKGRPVGFLDSAVTDQQGRFAIDSIFYGDAYYGDSANVRFLVYADTSKGHLYSPRNASVVLSTSNPTYDLSSTPFKDTTVLTITGQVYQVCVGCLDTLGNVTTITGALDSVRLLAVGAANTQLNPEVDSAFTGYHNPPGQYGTYALNLQEPDTYTVTPAYQTHKFVPAAQTAAVTNNVTGINFQDTTTHMVSGYFTAGCKDPIGSVTLEFDDYVVDTLGKRRTSVFREQVTTGTGGYYAVRLPARKYTAKLVNGNISDPVNPSLNYSTVFSFFASLSLDSLSANLTNKDTVLNLVYKRAPVLQISGILAPSAIAVCPAYAGYTVWPQGATRTAMFNAFQGPVSKGCPLDSSTLVVYTSVELDDNNLETDTLKVLNGTAALTLKAGAPLTLAPYHKIMEGYLYDQYGRMGFDSVADLIVTGVSVDSTAQTFVTVTPQIPLLVLHDPPGNGSFSQWSSGVTTSTAYSVQAQSVYGGSAWAQVTIGGDQFIGIGDIIEQKTWGSINENLNVSATNNSNKQFTLTQTTTNSIQTSSASAPIGPDADLFYGAAMNLKYTVGSEVDWDSIHCAFTKKNVMVFAPTGINTSFVYTLAEIRDVMIPKLQLAAQTNPDSASYFNNQISVWQQLIANNTLNLQRAPIDSNISFSGGASFSSSTTTTADTSNTYQFSLNINNTVALQCGFSVAGAGIQGGVTVNTQWTMGSTSTTDKNRQVTTGYTLTDSNPQDLFSVNLKTDPVYGTPMFQTVAGESACPHEVNTVALDSVYISSNVPLLTNVAKDTAAFIFSAGNLSIDPNPRTYKIYLNQSSNPDGAFVYVNGQVASQSSPVLLSVPNGTQQKVTVNVIRNTANGVYNYNNLIFTMSDDCDGDITRNDTISVDFAAPVSSVTLVAPANNFVANMASNNVVPVQFNGYDTSRLQTIAMQYTPAGTVSWTTVFTDYKTSLGSSLSGTSYSWNIGSIPDGTYNVRLVVQDKYGNVIYTPYVTGTINRTPPGLYGVPQPANGIYNAGTQISYSYTKTINNTNLRPSMVQLIDVATGITIPVQLSAFANTLVIVPTVNILQYTGDNFRVVADSVSDQYGNTKLTPDTAYFVVGSANTTTGSSALNITIGTNTVLENTTGVIDVHFTRNSVSTTPTVIYYSLAGNAVYNSDYTVSYSSSQPPSAGISGAQGTIVLPADSLSVVMYIHPVNNSQITSAHTVAITLGTGGGYSTGTYYNVTGTLAPNTVKPTITSFTPLTASTGQTVTITGTGFTGATAVSFGGTKAASFTVISATSIQAVVGTGTTGSVSVTTAGGTATLTGFTYCSLVTPTLSIAANIASPICTGTKVTFTATAVNGGTAPVYQWYKDNNKVGTNSSTYADSLLKTGDSVWCVVTSNATCLTANTATSAKLKYTVNALVTPSVTIAANIASPICTGIKVTFTATAVNGGTTPVYQWYKDNNKVGTNSSTYADSLLKTGDSVWCVVTSNATCLTANTATSAKIKYTVNALAAPTVTIAANIASPICTGTKVTFTATAVNGGTTPVYQWYKDNNAVGTNSSTYADSLLKTGDSVWCVVTSNATCLTANTATSAKLTYTVNALSAPSVTVAANVASPICTGTKVTFTATVVNGGTAPVYQWYKDNNAVGINSSTYADSLLKTGDSVWCVVTSNATCLTANTATSAKLKYTVNALITPSVTVAANIASPICTGTKVTFTATAVNGGTTPVYQWYKDNNKVGTSSSTYADSLLKTGDSVWCVITASGSCLTANTATSAKLTYTVNALSAPSVTIAANIASPICTGTKVTFTATAVNGGTVPVYQWYKDNNKVGTNSSTYADSLLKTGDSIWCVVTSNASCLATNTATSAKLKYTVNTTLVTPSVSITANVASPVCTGTKVTFTATVVNGGNTQVYQWYKDNNAVGTNSSTYADSLLKTGDSVWCVITVSGSCLTANTAASAKLKYNVNALVTPSLTIAANIASPICTSTKVTFTATAVNGGTTPVYQWYKDNNAVGTNSSTYADSLLKTGDSIWCVITVSGSCLTANTATSAKLTYTVNALVTPSLTIAANIASPICASTKVTFTATAVNGGTAPVYQWYKDNNKVGTSSSTYADSLLKTGDSVWCVVTSNATCLTANTATSAKLTYTVNALSAPSLTIAANIASPICTGTKVTFTAMAVSGGTVPVYQWYKDNNKVGTNSSTYADSLLKTGDSIWCVITVSGSCLTANTATSAKLTYTVNAGTAPSVSITANPGNIVCYGTKDIFTAVALNAGTAPTYQWYKDNNKVGTNSSTYADSALIGSDSVWVTVTAATACGGNSVATSNKITIVQGGSPQYLAYIPNASSKTVSVINVATGQSVATIPIGSGAGGVAITPNSAKAYFTNWQDNTVSVVNTATNTVTKTISGFYSPQALVASPDGSKIYVVNASGLYPEVMVINTSADTIINNLSVTTGSGGASWVVISPDGTKLYAGSEQSSLINVISTVTNSVINTIHTPQPWGLQLSPNGATLYATNYGNGTVTAFNTATYASTATITVGSYPVGMATSLDGTKLYVANTQSNTVSVINTASNTVSATINNVNGPYVINLTPNGSELVTSDDVYATATFINPATNTVTGTAPTGGSPLGFGNFIASQLSACPVLTPAVTINANAASPICPNTKVTFTAAAVNGGTAPVYQWYKDNNKVGTNSSVYADSLLKTGDSVWCTMASNASPLAFSTAKSNVLTYTVSTVVAPSVSIAASTGSSICTGTKVTFTATAVNSGTTTAYQWYKDNNKVGLSAATYTDSLLKTGDSVWCVATGNTSCTAGNTAKSNLLHYTVNPVPVKPVLTQTGTTSFCLYDSLILNASAAAGSLQWYRNNGAVKQATTSRYAVKVAGNYKLQLTNSSGCSIMSDSVIVSVTQVPRPTITLVNDTLVSSSATGNQWFEDGVLIAGATGAQYSAVNIDAYTVQVTSGGCASPMSDPYIYTAGTNSIKGKKTALQNAKVLLYPNPAGSVANLQLSGFTGGVIVTVTDMAGKIVWRQDRLVNSTYTLPLNNLAQGMYIVTIKDKTNIMSLKLVKAK